MADESESSKKKNNNLTFIGSFKHYLGQVTSDTNYPSKKIIYIDNNNE